MMSGMSDLQARVIQERQVRGAMSIRAASRLGNVSNTLWGAWENSGGPLGPTLIKGIADAFGWDLDWPENPPPPPISEAEAAAWARTEAAVHTLAAQVADLRVAVEHAVAQLGAPNPPRKLLAVPRKPPRDR